MFAKNRPVASAPVKPGKAGPPGLSFIGPEVLISGDLTTGAQLHVDGRIDGHVRCAQLCQGATGVVAGDIVSDEARIAGLVQGTVNSRSVIIEASARVTGDVTYETISIAAGAQIDGRLARRDALATADGAPALLVATPIITETVEKKADGAELFPQGEPKRVAIG